MHKNFPASRIPFQVFTEAGGDRSDVPDIVIVFTDGKSHKKDLTIQNAEGLKRRGVRILAIGAGDERAKFKEELEKIASSPQDVQMVEFDQLDSIVTDLVNQVCRVVTTAPPGKDIFSSKKFKLHVIAS